MIPEKQLNDLGFIRIRNGLYVKNADFISLYRDYRGIRPVSYAYAEGKRIDPEQFKEHHALMKIERSMLKEKLVTLRI